MGIWDGIKGALDPYGHPISNAVGRVVDATTPNGGGGQIDASYARRKALIDKLSKTPVGRKHLAYMLKSQGYEMAIAGPKGFKWATHGYLTLGSDPKQVERYNMGWEKIQHPPVKPPGRRIPPPQDNGGPPPGAAGGGAADLSGGLINDAMGAGADVSTTDYGDLFKGLNTKTAALLKPRQYAKNQAGLAFDPKINELLLAQKRMPGQAAQNEADIASWYKQVGDQQAQGIQALGRDNATATKNVGDVGAQLVAAAGGNEAAAANVAGAATNDAGILANVGASDLALANRLKELTSLEGKTKGIDEQRYQAKLAADMALELANTRGQKGAAFADSLSKALAFNNEARQTNFGNRLSAIQTRIGADAAGVNLASAQLGLAGDKVDLAGKILTYKQAQEQLASGGKVYWNKMAPEARAGLVNAAVAAVMGKKGNPTQGAFDARREAYAWARRTAGVDNPNFRTSIDRELARRFPQWFRNTNK